MTVLMKTKNKRVKNAVVRHLKQLTITEQLCTLTKLMKTPQIFKKSNMKRITSRKPNQNLMSQKTKNTKCKLQITTYKEYDQPEKTKKLPK